MATSLQRACWATAVVAVLATTWSSSAAQSPAAPSIAATRTAAEKAFRAGRYEDVDRFAEAASGDAAVAVIRAKALIARGEYAAAEAILAPLAKTIPAGDAALELGLLQRYVGRRVESRRTLQTLVSQLSRATSARDMARAGNALRSLGLHKDAESYFRDAVGQAPDDAVINTAWGDLFLEKYNRKDAAASYQVAIKAAPDYGPAYLSMARAVADENPPAARQFAARALELNPSDVGAHLFLARLALDQDKKSEARAAIATAAAINPHSIERYALTAAIDYVEGKEADYKQAIAAALEINPVSGEALRVVGEVTASFYRFDEAAEQTRRAIAIDPSDARAQAELGAQLMRTGDERNARRALETAFRLDNYDVVTHNLLEMLDRLDKFAVIEDGDLVIKLHPDEAGVMREYVLPLAKEALSVLSKRWEFTPKGPILIEIFPEHDDFAVRTLGLPGMIGALGACFGRVVTMDSPTARRGEFNWGATLWHELAHVITLQLSNQRIPRWLSEGISEYEEAKARPEWGRDMAVPFVRAVESGSVLKLRDLNAGFQNPETIGMAYYQASLLVEHLIAAHGDAALRALVKSFADGIDTAEALQRVLKIDFDALQGTFDAFLAERFTPLRRALAAPDNFKPEATLEQLTALGAEHPDSFAVQMALGRALRGSDRAAAIQAYERAAALVPEIGGPEGPQMQIVEIAMAAGDRARAARALEAIAAQDDVAVDAGRQLVTLLDPAADEARLRVALQRVVAIDPFDAPSHTALGRMALKAGQATDAVRNFRVALAAGAIDKASAHADLAEGLLLAGNRTEARRQALSALEIAPTYERAQDLLLKLADGAGPR